MTKQIFTSESVTEGHPDKIADQISDAILDQILAKDSKSRVAIETMITNGICIICGEVTTDCYVDMAKIARQTIKNIGYTDSKFGFHWETSGVMVAIKEQSSDIARGVDSYISDSHGKIVKEDLINLGAGDQGCLKKGTLVRTDRGFIPIELVKKGDKVITPYGFKKVVNAKKTGAKKTLELVFLNGMSLECTPDHKILCFTRVRGKEYKNYWKAASKLRQGELICVLKPSPYYFRNAIKSKVKRSFFYTKYNHKIYGPEELFVDEELAYILGEIIGDGSSRKRNSLEIAFGKNLEHAQRVKTILDKKMPKQWKLIRSRNAVSLKIDSVLVRKHFENFGLGYEKSPHKTTPKSIFVSSPEVICSYLRGLFDSDGTIVINTGREKKNIRIRLCSSSLKLLRETQLLLNDFEVKSTIIFNQCKGTPVGKDRKYKSNYNNYVLSLSGFESYQKFGRSIGFSESRKRKRMEKYIRDNKEKQNNSKGLYLMPHPYKNELIDEKKLCMNLPFALVKYSRRKSKGMAEVYDLEIKDVNMFSGNGLFVHNSVYGYACTDTPELMPLPITLAHKLTEQLAKVRKNGMLKWLRPDGKSQVSVTYQTGSPYKVEKILIAAQHEPEISRSKIKDQISKFVIEPVIFDKKLQVTSYKLQANFDWQANTKKYWKDVEILINTTGKFVIGGPQGDTGLTGRKNIVDTYGGVVPHGGGSLSGKDPTKVDRSGQYVARWVAKNIVANKLAQKCLVGISYAIGKPKPFSISVDTFGTGLVSDQEISKIISKNFDLRPGMIIKNLNLRKPIYLPTASYGHFGRPELRLPWERIIKLNL